MSGGDAFLKKKINRAKRTQTDEEGAILLSYRKSS